MVTKGNNQKNPPWDDYRPERFEAKWQQYWEDKGFHAAQDDSEKPKYYCLDFFPYPSGDGLHVGHCRNYVPTDLLSRYLRLQGYNVLHPMGWDAFGEPAEQYAISHGVHPSVSTKINTANFRRQMTMIGTSYDWNREINSSDPDFYRWTQWFFLLMYKRGLAYRDSNWQWWCPTCQTTLSSHEVLNGVCWRGHTGVIRREIPAWYFKITAYAEELLSSLDAIDWPEKIKSMQRNWIGRSEGFEIDFITDIPLNATNGVMIPKITAFTTRPDTLYGATFFLLAPEHPAVESITTQSQFAEIESYRAQTARRSEVERMIESSEKTGVYTGAYVINPVNGEKLPVWIADFVLPDYGSGAVMGVPAHDQRDYEFAKKFGLPVRRVISPDVEPGGGQETISAAYEGDGFLINSGAFTGLPNQVAIRKIADYLKQKQIGRRSVSYHMRDWLISRQRYWGTPIPILYCQQCGEVPVPEEQLPVLLPEMVDFQPDGSGRSPLASVAEFVNTTCPKCAGPARRETDTMGGFACSSWYFLRFTSPRCPDGPFEPAAMRYWMPVDLYVGGAEHAVLHLLYARFWTKVMADAGLVPFREPFTRLMNQGQMLGPDGQRMSKSRGNVITPDSIVDSYGADALRVYELFMAPFDQDVEWSTEGLRGAWRFLNRMWNLYKDTYHQSSSAKDKDPKLEHRLHQTIRQVTQRIQDFRINTLISTLMEFQNELLERQRSNRWRTATFHQALRTLLVLMAPVAPHISEELWHRTGHTDSVHRQSWPSFDPELASEDLVQLAVQVNGRLREVVEIPVGTKKDGAVSLAFAQARVRQHIADGDVTNIIYVPGKVLNIVTRK